MLEISNLTAGYQKGKPVLVGLSLKVANDETVAVLGQNGAGKSTLCKTILGLVPHIKGSIRFEGAELTGMTANRISGLGIALLVQDGGLFSHLSGLENLRFAGVHLDEDEFRSRLNEIACYFPFLSSNVQDRKNHGVEDEGGRILESQASFLSGGEKHQLAFAMILMRRPKLLILDEPSAGLSPANTRKFYEILSKIKADDGLSIILIEQNVGQAIKCADRTVVINPQTKALTETHTVEEVEKVYFN